MRTQSNYLRLNKEQYVLVSKLCRYSKNMYNVALYNIRQQYILNKTYIPYKDNYHLCKENENYKLLNTDIAQQTIKNVDEAMKAFFRLLKLKLEGKYQDNVILPGYLGKNGLFIITFPNRALD